MTVLVTMRKVGELLTVVGWFVDSIDGLAAAKGAAGINGFVEPAACHSKAKK